MPHFRFHLRRRGELIADDEGAELPHLEAAYLQAFDSAEELWPMLLAKREDPIAYSFEVVDARGRLLFVLPLAEVLETARKRSPRVEALAEGAMTSTLLARAESLRTSLVDQIAIARRTVDETRALLNNLGKREPGA